jgi:hypothetical protein
LNNYNFDCPVIIEFIFRFIIVFGTSIFPMKLDSGKSCVLISVGSVVGLFFRGPGDLLWTNFWEDWEQELEQESEEDFWVRLSSSIVVCLKIAL